MSYPVWIYGHWMSENMGDRYQPRGIAEYLSQFCDISKILFVNFFSDTTPMEVTIGNKTYPVVSPEVATQYQVRLIILTTGSIDRTMSYIQWLPKYLKQETLQSVIIWGGFSHVTTPDEFKVGLECLSHPKVTFWARSYNDLNLYQEMYPQEKAYLGGDPMIYWIYKKSSGGEWKIIPNPNGSRVIIISIHAYERYPEIWERLIQPKDRLIAIDLTADDPLGDLFPQLVFISSPDSFLELLEGSREVISSRLHGGLLAVLAGIPTTLINIDDAPPGQGSFKFEAVATSGSGERQPLCQVISIRHLDAMNPKVYLRNIRSYLFLTSLSLLQLRHLCIKALT